VGEERKTEEKGFTTEDGTRATEGTEKRAGVQRDWVIGEFPSRDKLMGILLERNCGRGRIPCLNTSRMRDSR
jgi:hypothetical protein